MLNASSVPPRFKVLFLLCVIFRVVFLRIEPDLKDDPANDDPFDIVSANATVLPLVCSNSRWKSSSLKLLS